MQFNANQLREDALPKKGRYQFKVLDTREKVSKNGNQMLNLTLSLNIDGRPTKFWSSLIFIPKMFWQVEHFCESTGIPEKIEEGQIMAQECDGLEGWCDLDHRVNNESGATEAYIKDYVKPEVSSSITPDKPFDDDIDF